MKKKQVRNLVLSLGLVAAIGAGATFALLSATSKTVTNTFAVGDGYVTNAVTLDETEVKDSVIQKENDGTVRRTEDGSSYTNLQQGDILTKDPQVHIKADSAKSYVFVNVTGLQALKDAGIAVDWDSEHWVKVDSKIDSADTNYFYSVDGEKPAIVDPTTAKWDSEKLFTTLDLASANLYKADGSIIDINDVVVKACAVQATTTQNGVETNVAFEEALELMTFAK